MDMSTLWINLPADAKAVIIGMAGEVPSQAEWETAARSRHGKEYPWGGDGFDNFGLRVVVVPISRPVPDSGS